MGPVKWEIWSPKPSGGKELTEKGFLEGEGYKSTYLTIGEILTVIVEHQNKEAYINYCFHPELGEKILEPGNERALQFQNNTYTVNISHEKE